MKDLQSRAVNDEGDAIFRRQRNGEMGTAIGKTELVQQSSSGPFQLVLPFLLICAIWGTTWLAIKVCLDRIAPLLLGGTRFAASGTLILIVGAAQGASLKLSRRDIPRLLLVSVLLVAILYSALIWAMLFVPTGLAAVVNLSLIPIAMLGFGILLKEEIVSSAKLIAIGVGIAGLVLLFGPGAGEGAHGRDSLSLPLAAIVIGTVCGCAGTVVSRPLLRIYSALVVAGWTNLIGGLLILLGSSLLEPGAPARAAGTVDLATVIAWNYLVVLGSGIAMTVYLKLVREWGPVRASGYAFLSPLIALAVGILVENETLTSSEIAASGLLLAAVIFNLMPQLMAERHAIKETPR